ncbi:hypothetical protein POVWA2_019310 [Plasmodium ovale wallikeri]|nr:hypothetical protein POVWA2_019310 [Plasmodium ovale wallikeri]
MSIQSTQPLRRFCFYLSCIFLSDKQISVKGGGKEKEKKKKGILFCVKPLGKSSKRSCASMCTPGKKNKKEEEKGIRSKPQNRGRGNEEIFHSEGNN